MTRTYAARKTLRSTRNTQAHRLFATLPASPLGERTQAPQAEDAAHHVLVDGITEKLRSTVIDRGSTAPASSSSSSLSSSSLASSSSSPPPGTIPPAVTRPTLKAFSPVSTRGRGTGEGEGEGVGGNEADGDAPEENGHLRVITWDDVCPYGDRIDKIAEASFAEVYRVTNGRGVSIIKAIRLDSPIKPQTKAQQRSGLVDEEPHHEQALHGELCISEWLADIPGFVVYKERYVVQGKAPKALLETHQAFHRRAKRADPDRLQFYPSPSRYLDETRFMVVELGDAGVALEGFELTKESQLWDVFLHTAVALARAEDLIRFEHRDLHEGNLCIRQVGSPRPFGSMRPDDDACRFPHHRFGYSGLDITVLDYGLSRAEESPGEVLADEHDAVPRSSLPRPLPTPSPVVVAFDLEKDLSLFTSTHAPQCRVYRQMRTFLLRGDRGSLGPETHTTPYDTGPDGSTPISWAGHHPYTNVLWLHYIYRYLVRHFRGDKKALARFRRETRELLTHLDPDAPRTVLSFPSAADVVRYAAEAGWVTQAQLMGGERSHVWDGLEDGGEDGQTNTGGPPSESIIEEGGGLTCSLRRSPRKPKGSTSSTGAMTVKRR